MQKGLKENLNEETHWNRGVSARDHDLPCRDASLSEPYGVSKLPHFIDFLRNTGRGVVENEGLGPSIVSGDSRSEEYATHRATYRS